MAGKSFFQGVIPMLAVDFFMIALSWLWRVEKTSRHFLLRKLRFRYNGVRGYSRPSDRHHAAKGNTVDIWRESSSAMSFAIVHVDTAVRDYLPSRYPRNSRNDLQATDVSDCWIIFFCLKHFWRGPLCSMHVARGPRLFSRPSA